MRKMFTILPVIGLVAALGACGPYQLTPQESMNAELGARDYADRTQSDYVSCSGQDSDKDGYVSCGVKLRTAAQTFTEIQCGYKSRGCKRSK